jgi:hypothetical protein
LIPVDTRICSVCAWLQRVDGVVTDPDELEAGLVHANLDHVVERVLDPGL